MNEIKPEFEEIIRNTALEYEIEITNGFVDELWSQCSELFGDCGEDENEF